MKTVIEFEDHEQDFLVWSVDDETHKVIESKPFQSSIWCKYTVVNFEKLEVGGFVEIEMTSENQVTNFRIKYPIKKISHEN